MPYIIAIRNPRTKTLSLIQEDDEILEFDTEDAAHARAETLRIATAWGYQVVEIV